MTEDEKPVPEQVRDAIEDSEWPELSIREVMERTGLSKQQVITAGASMDRLEIDQAIGAVRLPEDDGGEFHDDPSRELRTDGGQVVSLDDRDTENIGGKEPDGKPASIGRWTFQTKKVRDTVLPYLEGRVLNAFAGKTKLSDYKRGIVETRNDLNPEHDADYHVDAALLGYLFDEGSFDVAVLDPPYSQTQADEHYDGLHARDMGQVRKSVAPLVKTGGRIVELGRSLWDASDYYPHWEREEKLLFRRGIPDRDPILMTVCVKSQSTLEGYE